MSVGSDTFDPYRKWLGIPVEEQPPHHYRLLGLRPFESDLDVISHAVDRCMGHVRTFQAGSQVDLSQKILNELAAARLCLLGENTKAQYDRQLQSAQAAPATVTRVAPTAVIAATPVIATAVTATPVTAVAVSSVGQSSGVGIRTSSTSPAVLRRRRRRVSSAPLVLGGVACLILLGSLLAVVLAKQGGTSQNQKNEKPRTVIIKVPAVKTLEDMPKKSSSGPGPSVPKNEPRYESSDELYDSVDGRYRSRRPLE